MKTTLRTEITVAHICNGFVYNQLEGIVFWRDELDPDCDKCKINRRDFGLVWPTYA